jgi:addiction module HigA family antidote
MHKEYAFAIRGYGVNWAGLRNIVHGKRAITADTALRLGRFFGMSPQFWLNLQNRYDLEVTEDMLVGRLDKEVHALNSHAA